MWISMWSGEKLTEKFQERWRWAEKLGDPFRFKAKYSGRFGEWISIEVEQQGRLERIVLVVSLSPDLLVVDVDKEFKYKYDLGPWHYYPEEVVVFWRIPPQNIVGVVVDPAVKKEEVCWKKNQVGLDNGRLFRI